MAWQGGRVDTGLLGLLVVVATLAAATGFGMWHRGRSGRARPTTASGAPAEATPDPTALPADHPLVRLGVAPGLGVVTLLQFSSAFCAPCRATRVVCERFTADRDDVRHREVDAESQLEAVRALGIWRTPTVLVVDASGRITARITGAPTQAQLAEAVAPLLTRETALPRTGEPT